MSRAAFNKLSTFTKHTREYKTITNTYKFDITNKTQEEYLLNAIKNFVEDVKSQNI